jgi:3-oxoacyl-[acyl-carrier protein] reductase
MRTVLLTGIGGAGQVGVAVARLFATRGDQTLLIARDPSTADARARELVADGLTARGYSADLSQAADVERLAREIASDHGEALDSVVHMAGGFGASGAVADSDPADLTKQLSINLWTAYHVARSFVPFLRPRRGSIVFFASESVLPGGRVGSVSAYAIAKAGVVTLTRAIAQEERGNGVRSNAIAPGAIRTGTNLEAMGADAKFVEREAVAELVAFLCSDAGASISGEVIHLAAHAAPAVPSSP